MRGHDAIQESWFSYVSLEERIPKQHPLRRLRLLVDGRLGVHGCRVCRALRAHRAIDCP